MNGKRRMLDSHRHQSGARTNSSPRTVITPLGPNRLTLPPDHQQPSFSSDRASHSDDVSGFHDEGEGRYPRPSERPGSRRFTEQYAYMPPETPQSKALPPPVLSHAQTAPLRQVLARQTQAHGGPPVQAHTSMPPPPLPVGRDARDQFRPGPSASAQLSQAQQTRESVSNRMLPPPTPQFQRSGTLQQRGSYRPPQTSQLQTIGPNSSRLFAPPTPVRPSGNISTNRFLLQQPPQPPQQHQGTAPSSGSLQRFSSSSVNDPGPSASLHSGGPNLRAPSRTASVAMSGGQRFPFVPGA
ncbi:hypothetical protein WOLCODRAFT_161368 [Wolfiporia cocos MD-104 SS10]|uniref:Uncharacterized protein n=1 Tax=Wolfiporia cocos (strain MD-104) TaxID=742152 RepID=A0A2H3JKB8_WOLCO|nr:hypothetical protein WOLCODRAFT_161368 [Wolfiporia cocos MD-104 SS10]